MAISTRGVVAAESTLAAQAGAVVLARGGHAVEAAIAANAVMGVVAPMMNGIGGDLFAIVHDGATGTVHGLNASGWAPAAMTIDALAALGMPSMPQRGIHSVTVPGAVAGWVALHEKFGRLSLQSILSAAIAHAGDGFPVSEITALEWQGAMPALQTDRHATATYLPGGRAPSAGELFRNADLARTLRAVARDGGDAFYHGEVATRILDCSAGHGGALGTDLTEVGLRRGASYLRAALVQPEAAVPRSYSSYRADVSLTENFLQVRVVTAAGAELTGVRVNEDTFSIQVRDATNRIHSFWKSELRALHKDWGRSPMPSYAEVFTAAQLDDLVAFLAAQRGDR